MASNNINLPESFLKKAADASNNLLPQISCNRYEDEYKKFCEWLKEENIEVSQVVDDVLLVYLSEKSNNFKPSTLWSRFSMIKKCLQVKENIDVSSFPKTMAFLKKQSTGYVPKKASVFTADQISKFMVTAPDNTWLLDKVILILGIFGACRRDDLVHLSINDVKDNITYFTVFLRDGKTHKNRSFTITDDECSFKPCQLIRKYMLLRPTHMKSDRFFIAYRGGKCIAQNAGGHKICGVPKKVAEYLKLSNPQNYTGHALRRSSASMMVEGGKDMVVGNPQVSPRGTLKNL